MPIPNIKLADGNLIPQLGMGLWKVSDEETFNQTFDISIKSGYKMFDSAQIYKNEEFLGNAIKNSKIKRSDLFITTKISVNNFGYKKTHASFKTSLEKLGLEYVDLLLLHFPVTVLRKRSWQALEEIQAAGGAKSIGVSNFTIKHLKDLAGYAKTMPVINQVELHVFLQQPELIDYCNNHKIVIEAYSPLAHGKKMDDPEIIRIAKKHKVSYAQVMLRFLIQLGLVVIPKSITVERIEQNIEVFNFKLDGSDMKALKSLDSNLRTCWNPTYVP